MARKVKPVRGAGPSAVQLVEEAVHLLRQAPPSTWAIYALGACPWALGFLFFWAYTAWFSPSSSTLSWLALGLVVLFVMMKALQAEFCGRLLAQRLGAPVSPFRLGRFVRLAVAQAKFQCWGPLLLPTALVLSVPFGWAYAYFQTLSVLGGTEEGSAASSGAMIEAQRWPGQNHMGLLYLSVLGFAAWINLAVTFYGIPWLANHLLGIQNVFGLSGWGWLNTTFVMSVTALTWLCVDPLVKAFYVLRVFYGRSQRTGEDLRVDLIKSSRSSRSGVAAVLLFLLVAGVVKPGLRADSPRTAPATATQAIDPAALDRSIDRVLERRDFQWQMRLKPKAEPAEEKKDGAFVLFLRRGLKMSKEVFRAIGNVIQRIARWIRELTERDPTATAPKKSGVSAQFLHVLLYLLIGAAVVLIVVVLAMMLKGRRSGGLETLDAQAVAATKPNLADEAIEATHLPSDGWLALAREQMAKGEWRLALRALYLATLAQLAAEGLVTLIKSKTNLDYERELRRRAPANVNRIERFTARRREFESVWYGRGIPGEASVRSWFDELSGGTSS